MFDSHGPELRSSLAAAPPEEVIDALVEDHAGEPEPLCWSEYRPDGLLADMLAQPPRSALEHREFEALERVGAWERIIAWAQARQMREMYSFMCRAHARNQALGADEGQAYDSAVAEVGLMLRVSTRTAAARVGDAWSLCTRLPATLAALESGRITLAKARVLDAETANLSAEHTAAVERQVLDKAPEQTPGQLRVATRRAVLRTDPAAARKRAEQARRERGVWMVPEPDGMATVSAYLSAADAVGVFSVIDEHARRAGNARDGRSMDARRADALVDLVLNPPSGCPEAARDGTHRCRRRGGADVRVTVPYTTLLGADDLPGELASYGPITADAARELAAGGTWRRILSDPVSGQPVDYGTVRYRPPAHLAGLVLTRDMTCQFPGCRVPAHRCDIDHGTAHDPTRGAGPTSDTNLGAKCRRHHQIKQTPGWSVTHHADGGTTWVTPSGHRYHSKPPPLPGPDPPSPSGGPISG